MSVLSDLVSYHKLKVLCEGYSKIYTAENKEWIEYDVLIELKKSKLKINQNTIIKWLTKGNK